MRQNRGLKTVNFKENMCVAKQTIMTNSNPYFHGFASIFVQYKRYLVYLKNILTPRLLPARSNMQFKILVFTTTKKHV